MHNAGSADHAHEDDLKLYARGRLEPGYIATIESHLLECKNCRERLSRSIGLGKPLQPSQEIKKMKYERSEPRFSAGDHAVLQELSPLSVDRQTVEIVDVSRNGLGVLAPKPLMPGIIV